MPKTGIGYYVYNLCKHLEQYDELEIAYIHKPFGRYVASFLKTISFPFKRILKNKYPKELAAFLFNVAMSPFSVLSKAKITKIDVKNFDLYHDPCHSIIPEFRQLRRVVDIHDLAAIKYPHWVNPEYRRQMGRDIKDLLNSNRIIVKSNYVKNELINDFNIDQNIIDVIPNALGATYRILKDKDEVKKYVSKFVKKDYILFTGTIEPRKNLKTLFKAFRIIRNKYDVALVIAGGFGWRFEEIIAFPKKLGIEKDVIFTSYASEQTLLYLYNFAKVLVFPSFYEGFGIPPLEAMACKTPVIASNSSSIPEVVGDAALTFNPHDYEELAYLMEKVLTSEELSEKLRRKGLERVKHFSWEKTAKMTIESYKKALGE